MLAITVRGSTFDVYRCQILMSKVDSRTVRVILEGHMVICRVMFANSGNLCLCTRFGDPSGMLI